MTHSATVSPLEPGLTARVRHLAGAWWNGAPHVPDARSVEELTAYRLASDGHSARITCALLLIPTIWFGLGDATLTSGDTEWLAARLLVRGGIVAALVAAAWLVPRSPSRSQYEQRVLALTLVAVAGVVALNALRPPMAGLPLRTPLVWLFALYTGFPNPPRLRVIAPWALTVGLLALPSFWDAGAHRESVSGNLLVLLTVNALGTLLVLRRQDLADHERRWELEIEARILAEQSLRELQTLKGIIPICSFCKRVRTEIGDWQQVEAYVRARSAADFSHGLCPHCTNEHYGEYLRDEEEGVGGSAAKPHE